MLCNKNTDNIKFVAKLVFFVVKLKIKLLMSGSTHLIFEQTDQKILAPGGFKSFRS